MRTEDKDTIQNQIAPLMLKGEASLLLGAGFSIVNESIHGPLPSGYQLRDLIVTKCGMTPKTSTTLSDAYMLGKREINDFDKFLSECFTVTSVHLWQERIFTYAWKRIYTTNIDNVLNIAHSQCKLKNKLAGEFIFSNYADPSNFSDSIGCIPVVSIHGTCNKLDAGFIFSSLDYAKIATKIYDWHQDLAARVLNGGLIVIGNQLNESDIDAHIAMRNNTYITINKYKNYIAIPNPDEIKASNYRSAGFVVIECTAEEFFNELYSAATPKSVADIVIDITPSIKSKFHSIRARTWFKSAFRAATIEIDEARTKTGILKHFIAGADPEWFYIVHDAHAKTSTSDNIYATILRLMNNNSDGAGILHITGQSGSGKTTAIRSALREIARTYEYIYEFDPNQEIDPDLLKEIILGFTTKSIFVFYSSHEYYYAINYIANSVCGSGKPFTLFILEERTNSFNKNHKQINNSILSNRFEFPRLSLDDATSIANKIESSAVILKNFSEFNIKRRANIIVNKERGYSGDLLSALYSLTAHTNFESKIYEEYASAPTGLPRSILDVVSILSSKDFAVPIEYIAGFLSENMADVQQCLLTDLADVIISTPNRAAVKCRHRIIAQYYFDYCIANTGKVSLLVGILEFLSRKFTVKDIRTHPLPHRIYKEIISFDFLYEQFFPTNTRDQDTERAYHEAQHFYSDDGLFWLHFGRFYRTMKRWDEAIDCLQTGLSIFNSHQTAHTLGVVYLEKYIDTGCNNQPLYNEGANILIEQQKNRGSFDPYPTTSLLTLLETITTTAKHNTDALEHFKKCINFGLKHYRGDSGIMTMISRHIQQT